ncbi:MAG: malate synthase A, partial [Tepidisphaeraceae bacterium]
MAAMDLEIVGPDIARDEEVLTPEALEFLKSLHGEFDSRRVELLDHRIQVQAKLDSGWLPDFLPETESVRQADWRVKPVPKDLQDRRVEITGPVDRKMVINALNSGARVFMADFEDANSPTWDNCISGQVNLQDAVQREISFESPEGKQYRLNKKTATLMVRPRGWHLPEKHVLIDGKPGSGSLCDFGLFFFHNARAQLDRGTGPYFYLPKLESHLEARLWNDVFNFAQDQLKIPRGTIKATVLIETILAAFEMDEILYELRDHSAGLNCGRWDYIFSVIKKFNRHERFVLPDRALVTMTAPFMRAYSQLVIKTCHKRGAHAMGGMAAQIPIKNDPAANEIAMAKVRADKEREAGDGHDGTWVAHPGLVGLAKQIFDANMPGPNQLDGSRDDVNVTASDLLTMPGGPITENGLRMNVNIALRYLESWLNGNGCVPIFNLMEDAATAEISRSQVWQWIRHRRATEDGQAIDVPRVRRIIEQEMTGIGARDSL